MEKYDTFANLKKIRIYDKSDPGGSTDSAKHQGCSGAMFPRAIGKI